MVPLILLILLFMGWTLPFSTVALFADLFTGGTGAPWESKHRWIRALGKPFLMSHAMFCKVQGIKQRV